MPTRLERERLAATLLRALKAEDPEGFFSQDDVSLPMTIDGYFDLRKVAVRMFNLYFKSKGSKAARKILRTVTK